jgi:GNAT superfamily N-acetyltransferase
VQFIQQIERAAGALFVEIGMDDVAAHPPLERDALSRYVESERAWIAEWSTSVAGYALSEVVDGTGYLAQVSVDPAYGRRGLGRMLVETAIEWTRRNHLPALTLSTFRDVPWNAPYYASLGFRALSDAEMTPGLHAVRDREAEIGLNCADRVFMRRDVRAS